MDSVTHVSVGVLSLGLGQWGVTVGAVVFTEVIGSLGVGGNQQLLDVSLLRRVKNAGFLYYSYVFHFTVTYRRAQTNKQKVYQQTFVHT